MVVRVPSRGIYNGLQKALGINKSAKIKFPNVDPR